MSKKDGTEATTSIAGAAPKGSSDAAPSTKASEESRQSAPSPEKSDKELDAAFAKHADDEGGDEDEDDATADSDDDDNGLGEDDDESPDQKADDADDESDNEDASDDEADDDEDGGEEEESAEEDESRVPTVNRGLTPRQRVEKARAALALSDLFTQDEIDKMPKEEVLRRGAKLLKQDEAFKQLKASKAAEQQPKPPAKNKPRPTTTDEDDSADPDSFEDDDEDNARAGRSDPDEDESADTPERPSAGGLDKVLRKVAKDLQLRDEETSALAKQVRGVLKQETQKYSRQLAQAREALTALKEQNGQLVKTTVATRFRSGVQSLQSKFPMLKDVAAQKNFAKFVAEHDADGTKVLAGSEQYAKFLEKMAWAAFGHRVKETVKREMVESSVKGRKGSADMQGASPSSRTQLTEEQYEDAVFRINSTPGLSKAEREKRRNLLKNRRPKSKD